MFNYKNISKIRKNFYLSIIFLGFLSFVFAFLSINHKIIIVKGSSMNPALNEYDIIFLRSETSYKQNQIVVFKQQNEFLIKRVIHTDEDSNFKFFQFPEGYLIKTPVMSDTEKINTKKPIYIFFHSLEKNSYWLEGDNHGYSIDSRVFGPIDLYQIQGRAVFGFSFTKGFLKFN